MSIVDQQDIAEAALPVAEFTEYLQLEGGLGTDDVQPAMLPRILRSAAIMLENRLALAIVRRNFTEVFAQSSSGEVQLSRIPDIQVVGFSTIGKDGIRQPHSIPVQVNGHWLTFASQSNSFEIEYTAGYTNLPSDLEHAWIMLAAQLYLEREGALETDSRILSLIAPYRRLRLGMGSANA